MLLLVLRDTSWTPGILPYVILIWLISSLYSCSDPPAEAVDSGLSQGSDVGHDPPIRDLPSGEVIETADTEQPYQDTSADSVEDLPEIDEQPGCGPMAGLEAGSPWPMPLYCAGHTSRTHALGPLDGSLDWSFVLADNHFDAPVIAADGTVYVTSSGTAGRLLRSFSSAGDARWDQPVATRASPIVAADQRVWSVQGEFITAFSVEGQVEEVWSHVPVLDLGAVVGANLTFYAIAGDCTLYAIGSGEFSRRILDLDTCQSAPLAMTSRGSIMVVQNGSFESSGSLLNVSPTGAVLWEAGNTWGVNHAPMGSATGQVYTFARQEPELYAWSSQGRSSWVQQGLTAPQPDGPAAVRSDGAVFFQDGGRIYGLDVTGRAILTTAAEICESRPVIDGQDQVYCCGPGPEEWGSLDPTTWVRALDGAGRVDWQVKVPSSTTCEHLAIGDDSLIVSGSGGISRVH